MKNEEMIKVFEDVFQKTLNELKSKSESDKTTQFEKGWHNCEEGRKIYLYEQLDKGKYKGFGLNAFGDWENTTWFGINIERKMTPEEVQSALTKQATKLGIVEGATVERLSNWTDAFGGKMTTSSSVKLRTGKYTYHEKTDTLCLDGYNIYQNGVFAKVVTPKEEPIMIGGRYEVKIYSGGYSDKCTTIDGHRFSKEFWEAALIVSETSKAGAYVGCDAANGGTNMWPVKTETIKQILSRF